MIETMELKKRDEVAHFLGTNGFNLVKADEVKIEFNKVSETDIYTITISCEIPGVVIAKYKQHGVSEDWASQTISIRDYDELVTYARDSVARLCAKLKELYEAGQETDNG